MTRILVVDDNEDAREITRVHLNAAGYPEVRTVGSGEEALEVLSGADTYDAALLDVMMDGIDGIETCARIRTDPRHADLPILMVTSLADVESLSQAFVAGATDYIVKPVRRMELTARLRSALRLKAELDRRRAREAELAARIGPAAPHLAERATGLPSRPVLEAMLAEAPRGSGVVAAVLERGAAGDTAWAVTRRAAAVALTAVTAPLGSLLADLGDGLLVALLPPGRAPAPVANAMLAALRGAAPTGAPGGGLGGGLSGQLRLGLGHAVAGADPRATLGAAVTAAERAAESGHDQVIPA